MDQDKELARAKWFLGALALFVISGFYAFDELRYAVWGKTVSGNVTQSKAFSEAGRRGRSTEMVSVEYSFPNETGGSLNGRDAVPIESPIATATGPIMIQHILGTPDSSRIAANRNMGGVYLFLGSLAIIAGVILKLYREAKASERRPVRRSR